MRTAWSRCSMPRSTSRVCSRGQRAQSPLQRAADLGAREQQSDRADDRGLGLASVLFIANREMRAGTLTVAQLHPVPDRAVPGDAAAAAAAGRGRPAAAGHRRGRERVRGDRCAGGARGRHRSLTRARGEVEFRRRVASNTRPRRARCCATSICACRPGATVAIVGRSGSGKSTLVSLLPRFYDPTAGTVLIDGVDIREYRAADLRRQISLVSQEVVLFNETIRNNILFGARRCQRGAAARAAARPPMCMEFVEQLPQGLDTMVGDRGVLLSGGQRQRIAIARALLRDTPILILDEATSALDTAAERHIQAALDQLVKNRTTLVIAHRLSTVEHADRILVMSEGDGRVRRPRRADRARRCVCGAVPAAVQCLMRNAAGDLVPRRVTAAALRCWRGCSAWCVLPRRAPIARLAAIQRLACPVIVVGNLSVGGSGKTPLVIWLVTRCARLARPGVVLRGYGGGGTQTLPRLVRADSDPAEVGDEALLLCAANRRAGGGVPPPRARGALAAGGGRQCHRCRRRAAAPGARA